MDRPAQIPFSQILKIDRRKKDPVYLQIAYQMIQAVQQGYLQEGDRLPGSRRLAKELGIHRKTMVAAMEELQLQGWLNARPSIGTFVLNPDKRKKEKVNFGNENLPKNRTIVFHKNHILDTPDESNNCPYHFTTGTPDYRIIKTPELARFYSAAIKRKGLLAKTTKYLSGGHPFFREQLSYYINLTRGFHIDKVELLTGNNRQILLYILTQLLLETGEVVLTSEYSYPFANMVFQQAGAKIKTIPLDEQGWDIATIRQRFRPDDIKLLYLQPQHQYPTTHCLSRKNREALIALSAEYGFIVVEDDAHYEINFKKTLHQPLYKMASGENVIYLGNFGGFLPPGFQTNFMLAPRNFIQEAQKYLNVFGRMDIIKEQALGEMIHDGDIHRYRRKAATQYRIRRDYFCQLLQEYCREFFDFQKPSGGWAFWLPLQHAVALGQWAKRCKQKGLFIPRSCLYQNQDLTALRLGYAHLNSKEIDKAVFILKNSFEEMNESKM